MDTTGYSEENREGNCSAFIRRIEPQASLLFDLSEKLLIMIDFVGHLRYDDLASSIVIVPPTI